MAVELKPGSAIQLKSRSDEHLSRKLFHLLSGSLVAYLFVASFSRKESVLILSLAIALLFPIDLGRLYLPSLNRFVIKHVGPLMREGEHSKPSGQFYYLLGLIFATLFLPKAIAVQAILTLAWLDPIASLYGVRFGKLTWKRALRSIFPHIRALPERVGAKTVEGSSAGFVAALLAGVVAWTGPWASTTLQNGLISPSFWHVGLFSLVGALTASLAEAWASQWDDNVNIPFWTGLMVWAAVLMAGYPLSF